MAFSDIIKSDIVDAQWNPLWDDIAAHIKDISTKPVLVLSTKYDAGSAEETQLVKMLQACKLTTEQYNVIQLAEDQKIAWHKLKEELKPEKILLLGIHPRQLGISALFGLNEVNHFGDCMFIPTLSLNELGKQDEMKKQLWNNGLKPTFVG